MMWMALALAAATVPAPAPAPAPPCAVVPFPSDIRVLSVVRVARGADGQSHFASAPMTSETKDYLKTGKPFRQIDFGAAATLRLVSGPADMIFPLHASLGREMFLTLQGGSFVTLPDGSERGDRPRHARRDGRCRVDIGAWRTDRPMRLCRAPDRARAIRSHREGMIP